MPLFDDLLKKAGKLCHVRTVVRGECAMPKRKTGGNEKKRKVVCRCKWRIRVDKN